MAKDRETTKPAPLARVEPPLDKSPSIPPSMDLRPAEGMTRQLMEGMAGIAHEFLRFEQQRQDSQRIIDATRIAEQRIAEKAREEAERPLRKLTIIGAYVLGGIGLIAITALVHLGHGDMVEKVGQYVVSVGGLALAGYYHGKSKAK